MRNNVPVPLSAAEHDPAVSLSIREVLTANGRITFAQLMDIALYHPTGGYYTAAQGANGRDYLTSPQVHPAFAALVSLQLEQMWRVLGEPNEFMAVELGAGGGELCRDVLTFSQQLEPRFRSALKYLIVEPAPRRQALQQATLPDELMHQVRWVSASALALPLVSVVGCFLSNELVDAFPVHRVVFRENHLYELYVIERDGLLQEVYEEPSTRTLTHYFDRLGWLPPQGVVVEVNLGGPLLMHGLAQALERGFVLTIDYGLAAEDLYSISHPSGTLRCYHHHLYRDDPYRCLGRQDVTTHVDFSTMILTGAEAGLRLTGLTSQHDFLMNLGWQWVVESLNQGNTSASEKYENLFALKELTSRAGLGAFNVLVQHKGVHDPQLDGFHPCNATRRRLLSGAHQLRPPVL